MRRFLTIADAAREIGCSPQKVRIAIHMHRLPAVNTSSGSRPTYLIRSDDLEKFLTPASSLQADAPKRTRVRERIDAAVPKVFG